MSNRTVLFVDDDPTILDTYRRLLGRQFKVQTAEGPILGLEAVETRGPFAVVVSDLRMPNIGGVEFLARVRVLAPDTVRVLLTGFANTEAAIGAVNEGRIFRFLNKPCPHEEIARTLEACIEQHDLVQAERELLEKTLAGSVKMLMDILGLVNPKAIARATRIRRTMRHLARVLEVRKAWQAELAGMLSQIGCLTISPGILDRVWAGEELTSEEAALYRTHPQAGSQLLAHIPRLEAVARIIAQQLEDAAPRRGETPEDQEIRRSAEMLRAALLLDRHMEPGLSLAAAIDAMRGSPDGPAENILEALATLPIEEAPRNLRAVQIRELCDTMVFAEDVLDRNAAVLVRKGQEASTPVIVRLQSYAAGVGVVEPLHVWTTGPARGENATGRAPTGAASATSTQETPRRAA